MGYAYKGYFDTRSVRKSERIEFWEERASANVIGLTCSTIDENGLQARFDHYDFGSFEMFDIVGVQHVVSRPAEYVRTHDKDSVFLQVLLKGTAFVNRANRCMLFNRGDLILYDTNAPYMHGFPEAMHQVIFDLPGEEFRARFPGWSLDEAVGVDGSNGAGVGIAATLRKAYAQLRVRKYLAPDPDLVNDVWSVLELAHDLTVGRSTISAYHLGIVQRVRSHIRSRIDDPRLDTQHVADHIGMSSRQLNRILALHQQTVKKMILSERLERARRIIERGEPGGANLSELAYNCGFSGLSQFSKSFRRHFGHAPSEARAMPEAAHCAPARG